MNNKNSVNNRTKRMSVVGLCLGLALSVSVAFCVEPPAVEWTRTFAGCGISYGHSVSPTVDGGFVVAGMTSSTSPFDSVGGAYVIRTDSLGDLQWHKTYGDFTAYSVQQTTDGGFVVAGTSWLGRPLFWGAVLLKTDAQGTELWQRVINESIPAFGYSAVQADDNGYVIAAVCSGEDSGVLLVKTDSVGTSEWVKRYHVPYRGDGVNSNAIQLHATTDGGYVIGTKTLLKVDSLGNQQWLRVYAGLSCAYAVVQTADGGFAATGPASNGQGEDERQIFLLKTDSLGIVEWMRKHAESKLSRGYSVVQTADGAFALVGATYDAGLVLRTDASGHETWSDVLHRAGEAKSILQTSDGGLLILENFCDTTAHTNVLGLLKLQSEQ